MPNPPLVIVGRLGRPHGIKGWLKIYSFTEPSDNLFSYDNWFIGQNNIFSQGIQYEEWLAHGSLLLVKLPGCDTPEQARLYTNFDIAVPRDQLPPLTENDYYWTDLEGLTVISSQDQSELGKVDHLFSTGSNDVMIVKGDKERLIPYIKNVVVEVNLQKGYLIVDWDKDF